LGTGLVGVKDAIDFARRSGTKYFIIEENGYHDKTALECAEENLKIMKQWGY